jgi:hypothetical protein
MHSPLPGSPMYLPWQLDPATKHHVHSYGAGYAVAALLLYGWGSMLKSQGIAPITDKSAITGEQSHGA